MMSLLAAVGAVRSSVSCASGRPQSPVGLVKFPTLAHTTMSALDDRPEPADLGADGMASFERFLKNTGTARVQGPVMEIVRVNGMVDPSATKLHDNARMVVTRERDAIWVQISGMGDLFSATVPILEEGLQFLSLDDTTEVQIPPIRHWRINMGSGGSPGSVIAMSKELGFKIPRPRLNGCPQKGPAIEVTLAQTEAVYWPIPQSVLADPDGAHDYLFNSLYERTDATVRQNVCRRLHWLPSTGSRIQFQMYAPGSSH